VVSFYWKEHILIVGGKIVAFYLDFFKKRGLAVGSSLNKACYMTAIVNSSFFGVWIVYIALCYQPRSWQLPLLHSTWIFEHF
jgi:hypothetical protein